MLKECTRCKIMKPTDQFHKCTRKHDGLTPQCKSCIHEYYIAGKSKHVITATNEKQCPSCKSIKPSSEFYKNKSQHDGLSVYCIVCLKIMKNNPDAKAIAKAYLHDYARANKDREKKKASSSIWQKNNRAKTNAYRKTYYQTPNGHAVILATNHEWRSRLSNSSGSHTPEQANELLRLCNYSCLKCSSITRIEFDHIVPLSNQGCNCIGNLQILCRKCNASKGKRHSTDYRTPSIIEWANSFPHNH